MKPARSSDDEPDVIDLTKCYNHQGILTFSIPPPSPFADNQFQSQMMFYQNDDEHQSNAIMTWSVPTEQGSLSYRINNNEHPTFNIANDRQTTQTTSKWRRALNKLLRRRKFVERKQVNPVNVNHVYNFGSGKITEVNTLTLRSNNQKRVHWFDDEENQINQCYYFTEQLQSFVQLIIDGKDSEDDFDKCQLALDQLQSIGNYREIKEEFEELIRLSHSRDTNRLIQQEKYIESLVSRMTVFSA
ncbi:unnamed protein product [Adineta ricciae]|nr:unnamed protein product [Adineta ricciae]